VHWLTIWNAVGFLPNGPPRAGPRQRRRFILKFPILPNFQSLLNIWIVLGTLLLLLAITRHMQEDKDKERICGNEPTASVCHR
jgi:hypothetical protein